MSNNSIVLNTNRPGFFSPQIRGNKKESRLADPQILERTFSQFENTNLPNSSSFRYGDKVGLISTQQLPVDYSKFENHTFFHSAIAKVNEAFDKIINFYPFDGSNRDIEIFEDSMTGFESYVLEKFTKNVGYLIFSGTQVGETTGGTYLSIVDSAGSQFSELSSTKTGKTLLNPNNSPFSFEFFINIPKIQNDNQILVQKISGSAIDKNMTLALSQSSSTDFCDLIFGITSGSRNLYVTSSIRKGSFSHVFAGYDRKGDQKLHLIFNGDKNTEVTSSKSNDFDSLNFSGTDLLLGSGSVVRLNNESVLFEPNQTLSCSLDEFRYYKSYRSIDQIKKYKLRNLDIDNSNEDSALILYYKFNEPYGDYSGNNLVLDSSGNGFTTDINNFNILNRMTASLDAPPLDKENINRSPVLFPSFPDIVNLNDNLMVTASLYDDYNPNLITKLVPPHYFEEGNQTEDFSTILGEFNNLTLKGGSQPATSQIKSAQQLTIFLLIWAKFFDELKIFTDAFSNLKNLSYDEYDRIPDDLLRKAGEIQGIRLPSMFKGSNVDQLFEGVDLLNESVASQLPLMKIQNTVWKRILASLPYVRSIKGTTKSVKSIFRSAGIDPDNIFLIREYGGTYEREITHAREIKKDIHKYLSFTGSNSLEAQTLDFQGRPNKKPTIKSGFLSGSRLEPGYPFIDKKQASVSIVGTNAPTAGQAITIRTSDGSSATFTCHATTTTPTQFSRLGTKHGIDHLKTAIESSGISSKVTVSAVSGTGVGPYSLTITQNLAGLDGNTIVTSDCNFYSVGGASAPGDGIFSGGTGFVSKALYSPHGISSNQSDGLFTTSSFTFEGQYRFDLQYPHDVTQSLARLHVTGTQNSSQHESAIANLIYNSGSKELTLCFVDSPKTTTPYEFNELKISNIDIFDSDIWNVSFGINSGDKTKNPGTGSYFLRAAKSHGGKIEKLYSTSSFYNRHLSSSSPTSVFSNIGEMNTSGSFITIGTQSLGGSTHQTFLNNRNLNPFYKSTNFTGEIGSLRFWSKELSDSEWKTHVRSLKNYGTTNPETSYLFEKNISGSFEKLRLFTSVKQNTSASDSSGNFRYFDFSHNNNHFTGVGFEPSKVVVKPTHVIFNSLTPYFDLSIADKKSRIRSLSDVSRRTENPYAMTTPVYEVFPGEKTLDDPRFAIEMSVMKGLNENILEIFSDYEFFNNNMGNTNILFSDRYPGLIHMRNLYFENVLDKLDLGRYRELFKWIDSSFTDLIGSLLPHTTKFMGINFIYENHVLERNRFRYLFDEIYLKSKPIVSDRTLSLSQFIALIERM